MAIVSVNPIPDGQTGREETSTNSRIVRYRVITDAVADGWDLIKVHASLPQQGAAYAFGSDSDATLTVRSRIPRRTKERLVWIITIRYSDEEEDQEQDKDGNPSSDPLDWRDRIIPYYVKKRVIVERSKFLGLFDDNKQEIAGPPFAKGGIRAPMNSAGGVLNPARERDHTLRGYRVSKIFKQWDDEWDEFHNAVNNDQFWISGFDRIENYIQVAIAINCALMHDITAEELVRQGLVYFRTTFNVLHDPDGFWIDELDRGEHAAAAAGDENILVGGGSISLADKPEFAPEIQVIHDINGEPLRKEVFFDGNGKPLIDPKAEDRRWLRWLDYKEKAFVPLGLGLQGA